MIANTAFLAALTLFLLVAWLAGELVFTRLRGNRRLRWHVEGAME